MLLYFKPRNYIANNNQLTRTLTVRYALSVDAHNPSLFTLILLGTNPGWTWINPSHSVDKPLTSYDVEDNLETNELTVEDMDWLHLVTYFIAKALYCT